MRGILGHAVERSGVDGPPGGSLAAAERAVRINPTNAFAQFQRASLLIAAGRSDEVIRPLDEVTLTYEKFMLKDFVGLQCAARLHAAHIDDTQSVCETWYALGGSVASQQALAAVSRK